MQYKKIMVPLDGSTLAAQAIPHAEFLAQTLDAELTLFTTVPELEETITGKTDQKQQEVVDEAERYLNSLAEGLKHHLNIQVITDTGTPAEKIADYVQTHGVDMIVMTTHGRSGLARAIYGSVAEHVLRTTPCPVMLIRSVTANPSA